MKKLFCILLLLATFSKVFSQSNQQTIDESEPGWHKVYNYKGIKESKNVNGRHYSAAQLSICDSLANWMQASYLPKAGIGDIKKVIFPEVNQYSPFNAAIPQGYGAIAYTWNVTYNAERKLERVPETETAWAIEANAVPGWPIRDLSTSTRYYFTMPSFEALSVGAEAIKKEQDLSTVSNLKPYLTFWIKNIEAGGGTEYVLLCKDNKSPFKKITKGEYLTLLEAGVSRAYEKEKKSILEKNAGNQKSIEYFMKYLDDKNAKRISALTNGRLKYKDRLAEIAEVSSAQPDIMLENTADIFEGNDPGRSRQAVYTIDPAMFELCKSDNPQWILASWNWTPMSIKEKHLHESIINNFNFDYVLNFFFYPEKVQGQRYIPRRSPHLKEVTAIKEKTEAGKIASLDKNIHFFEDYGTTVAGQKPSGWYVKKVGEGVEGNVCALEGLSGQWATVAGTRMTATNLKKPLPQNFTLSYDVVVPENFTWGAKGLVFILAKEKSEGLSESFIRLKLRPGSGGGNGEAEIETRFPSSYANGTKWFTAPGFSNDRKMNRVTVTIKKGGETLQILIDKEKIVEYVKRMPADQVFNAMSFEMGTSGSETEKFYVSNIKITKD